MLRIICSACKGRKGYETGGYNEYHRECSVCRGSGIDVEATLKRFNDYINNSKNYLNRVLKFEHPTLAIAVGIAALRIRELEEENNERQINTYQRIF